MNRRNDHVVAALERLRSARAIKSRSYGYLPDTRWSTFRRSRYRSNPRTRSRWLHVERSRASRRQRKRLPWTQEPRSNGTARTGEKWEKCQPRKLQCTAVTSVLLYHVVNSTSEPVTVHPTSWWPGEAGLRESHITRASRADRRQQGRGEQLARSSPDASRNWVLLNGSRGHFDIYRIHMPSSRVFDLVLSLLRSISLYLHLLLSRVIKFLKQQEV